MLDSNDLAATRLGEMEVLELQPEEKGSNKQDVLSQIERRPSDKLDYNEFYWSYMNANVPIVLTDVSNDWECRRNWITAAGGEPSEKTINFNYLRNMTNGNVPVANCSKDSTYTSQQNVKMPFHDFLDHWIACIANSVSEQNSNIEHTAEAPNLYLKDWHLKASLPNYEFYCVPKHFASDWLNEFLVATARDDYRFVYMGPKNSWTPFHCDVFGSYSWSTNIFGVKKWLLLPPGEELKLFEKNKPPFAINEDLLLAKNAHFITLYQQENEALFVPSGWFHQVTNLTDTISVNHNFINACNLRNIWTNLSANMQEVIAEIADCRQMENFDEHCQTVLRCSFGINYVGFLDMLEFIANRRLESAKDNGNKKTNSDFLLFGKYCLNDCHVRQDLSSIQTVLESIIADDAIVCESRAGLYRRCISLLEAIEANTN